jgi:hypothetical protein
MNTRRGEGKGEEGDKRGGGRREKSKKGRSNGEEREQRNDKRRKGVIKGGAMV